MSMPATIDWTQRITEAWNKSRDGIVEVGRLLIEAKAALPHGSFQTMVENDLPFKYSTAKRLMVISRDHRLVKGAHVPLLPPHWGTLHEISKLPDEQFYEMIENGTIHPEMQRKDVSGKNRLLRRKEDEARVMSLTPRKGRYKTLVIDPPWDYEWLSLAGRAAPGYATMSHDELLALNVGQWAEDDCHMYLWTTNNFMTRAVELMAHWGFQHKTILSWVKPRWGLGSYFRNSTEHVLFGVKGELRTRADNIATHFEAPVKEHSEKPDIFYDIVSKASYLDAGEIFQREERSGFINVFESNERLQTG